MRLRVIAGTLLGLTSPVRTFSNLGYGALELAADGPRHIWWNFVSSSEARIERARQDWKLGRFAPVIGESEFIPPPER